MAKKFTPWFLLVLVIISVTGFLVARLAVESVEAELKANQQLSVKLASQSIEDDLLQPSVHIRSLSLFERGFRSAINAGENASVSDVEQDFQTLLHRNPTYAQIRWLDEKGVEKVRVERIFADRLRTTPASELQDKSDRPYTQLGLKLRQDELYISDLDLNIENGQIQVPYQPTVRLAMRAFDDAHQPAGLLVLNVNVKDMLTRFPQYADDHNLTLLNQDGYWLVGLNPADEWGFMFNGGASFAANRPKAWQDIARREEGQAIIDGALYTWQTIRVNTERPRVQFNIELKALAELSQGRLSATRQDAVRQIIIVSIIILIVIGGVLYLLILEIEDRKKAQHEAMLANKAKSSFLAIMSHEIRTPMTGIMGFADMLLEDGLSDDSRKKVMRIQGAAKSLLTIINDILDISKLDADKFEIEHINFDPANLANDIVQLFYQTCPEDKKESLQVTAKISDNFPAAVNADPTRIRQILVNLMGNAVKFTQDGSVTLKCGFDEERSELTFDIIDTGIGISEENLSKLFEEFVQADASVSRQFQGTGLGLAVCKRLVDLMGGDIGVRSEPGKGSTFWFRLPCRVVDAEDNEGALTMHDVPLTSLDRGLSILVAEDNEINQMIIRSIVEKMGHDVTMVNNGVEAVESFKANPYDLILMDVRMPEMSGPDATQQIRQSGLPASNIPIIALTADVMADNKASYFEAGMNDCVGKPINPVELATAISKVLSQDGSLV